METEPLLRLQDVRLILGAAGGEVNILRGVNLDLARAGSLAIVGPSGSGKSSLLMVIAGLERATSGGVRVVGHDLARMDEDALARFRGRHVGIVFQAFHLIATMTALENAAMPLVLARAEDAYERAEAALARVGLAARMGHYPAQLSGGEQQRVAIARALVPGASLVLADEPTGNLDEATGGQVADLLFALRRESAATLLVVTHDMALARRCDAVMYMRDGRLMCGGDNAG